MDKSALEKIGLSKGEAEIYIILLKTGETTVSAIAKHTKIARPNVYDYINKLKEKGLASFVIKKNRITYVPSSPERLLDILEEKRIIIKQELPNMLSLYHPNKEVPNVEVYEGSEGFKVLMNDIIKTNADFVGWGGSERVKEYLPEYLVENYLKLRKNKKIRGKMLYVETEGVLKIPLTKFKKIPKEFTSPSTTLSYGDNVAIMIYSRIPVIIIIRSKEVSSSFKKHFEILWKKIT